LVLGTDRARRLLLRKKPTQTAMPEDEKLCSQA
jgi:hypothetical protein